MKKVLLVWISILTIPFFALGQGSIFSNPITGSNPSTSNPYVTGQVVASNLSVSGIGRSAGIGANAGSNRYNANGWTTSTSIDLGDYFTFTLTPASGYEIDFSGLTFTSQRSTEGPQSFELRTSINNYATTVATFTSTGGTINLSALLGINSSIEFRIYGYDATSGSGTYSINDFDFTGTINPTIPAPVHLISFNAENKDRKSMLSWSTAVEENNSHFLVQRSRDGVRYTNIGKVDGRGTVDFQNDYTFTDERPMSGVNYYRLQQVDFDGKSEYSPVVTATLRGLGAAVAPTVEVQEAVTLTLESALVQEGMVRILDASGRIVSAMALAPGQDQYQIPTGHLPTGVYFLNIQADGETTQQKLLK